MHFKKLELINKKILIFKSQQNRQTSSQLNQKKKKKGKSANTQLELTGGNNHQNRRSFLKS